MNVDVINRLIDNLLYQEMEHKQDVWLVDHTVLFVISDDNRWSCATSGCAAGYVFLSEAPEGSVFDADSSRVFHNLDESNAYRQAVRDLDDAEERGIYYDLEDVEGLYLGIEISDWARDVMGIADWEAQNIFFDFGGTEHIVSKLRQLISSYTEQ